MVLMTAYSVASTVTDVPQQAVAAADTIAVSDVGPRGIILHVSNEGASATTVTLVDPGKTGLGNPPSNPGTTFAGSFTNRFFRILPSHVDTSTGVATVTYSNTSSVFARLIRG